MLRHNVHNGTLECNLSLIKNVVLFFFHFLRKRNWQVIFFNWKSNLFLVRHSFTRGHCASEIQLRVTWNYVCRPFRHWVLRLGDKISVKTWSQFYSNKFKEILLKNVLLTCGGFNCDNMTFSFMKNLQGNSDNTHGLILKICIVKYSIWIF